MALKVSSRRLVEPLPKVRTCWVLICSLGLAGRERGPCESAGWRWGNMGSDVVMLEGAST
jgi:hypothetical protein